MIVNEIAKFWKPPIAPEELLRVAEPVQDPLVLVGVVAARRWCRFHQPSSTSVSCQRYYARLAKRCQRVGRHAH